MREEDAAAISGELNLKGLIQILSSFDQPVAILDAVSFDIAWLSPSLAEYLGVEPKEAEGKPCS